MYAYRPLGFRALTSLVEYETGGQTARFERFMADLMFYVAGGQHIDTERSGRFTDQLDRLYSNPFAKKMPTGVEEIKDYIRGKIRALRKKMR